MLPNLSVINTDFIQMDGNLTQESTPFSSFSICYTCSSTPFQSSNHPGHRNFVLKARVKAFYLADLRKMVLQWITTAGKKDNVWCATVLTTPGINCRGLSVETSITIFEVISDLSWKPILLMQINKIHFFSIFGCRIFNQNLLKACILPITDIDITRNRKGRYVYASDTTAILINSL
jgi:hypothetical protein